MFGRRPLLPRLPGSQFVPRREFHRVALPDWPIAVVAPTALALERCDSGPSELFTIHECLVGNWKQFPDRPEWEHPGTQWQDRLG